VIQLATDLLEEPLDAELSGVLVFDFVLQMAVCIDTVLVAYHPHERLFDSTYALDCLRSDDSCLNVLGLRHRVLASHALSGFGRYQSEPRMDIQVHYLTSVCRDERGRSSSQHHVHAT
jgi:hypothetical protein